MVEEIFGPVLTVFVFDDANWEKTLDDVDSTSQYGLTGSMYVLLIFFPYSIGTF